MTADPESSSREGRLFSRPRYESPAPGNGLPLTGIADYSDHPQKLTTDPAEKSRARRRYDRSPGYFGVSTQDIDRPESIRGSASTLEMSSSAEMTWVRISRPFS
jgi:hypothetical protein